jgi:hypothetical protein
MWRCSTLQCSTHSDIFAAFLGGRMIRSPARCCMASPNVSPHDLKTRALLQVFHAPAGPKENPPQVRGQGRLGASAVRKQPTRRSVGSRSTNRTVTVTGLVGRGHIGEPINAAPAVNLPSCPGAKRASKASCNSPPRSARPCVRETEGEHLTATDRRRGRASMRCLAARSLFGCSLRWMAFQAA